MRCLEAVVANDVSFYLFSVVELFLCDRDLLVVVVQRENAPAFVKPKNTLDERWFTLKKRTKGLAKREDIGILLLTMYWSCSK
jgi:hypothetical protein